MGNNVYRDGTMATYDCREHATAILIDPKERLA